MPVSQALSQTWHSGICWEVLGVPAVSCQAGTALIPPKCCLSMVMLKDPEEMWGREDVPGLSGVVWPLRASLVHVHLHLLLCLTPVLKISQAPVGI